VKLFWILFAVAAGTEAAAPEGWTPALRRVLAQPGVQWVLVDASSRRTIDIQWKERETPAPFGSLIKPFTALAYGASHGHRFPQFECPGREACWAPRGHGRIGLEEAIAFSCNSWFRQLAAGLEAGQTETVLERFGLRPPVLFSAVSTLAGYGDSWRFSVEAMAGAYCELMERRMEPTVSRIVRGMRMAAARGTAAGLGIAALAKTGTAPCLHRPGAAADGYVVAVLDRTAPPVVLLVQVHGATGAEAAAIAGRALRRLKLGER